jgi:hypothetical protein
MKAPTYVEKFALLVVLLALANILSVSYVVFFTTLSQGLIQESVTKTLQEHRRNHPHALETDHETRQYPTIANIQVVGGKRSNRKEIRRLSPLHSAKADATLQIDDTTVVAVGGFVNKYQNVSSHIQFLDISSQTTTWTAAVALPPHVAETHQGLAVDKKRRILYIVAGQTGSGCMPATSVGVRYWIDQDKFEELPPLPEARYSPGVEIVRFRANPNISYLHVFGGAGVDRKFGARDHWRLEIHDDVDKEDLRDLTWEEMESLPDAGVHGASFVTLDGYIHYTAYCQLDQGMVPSFSMSDCHEHAVASGQLLHHVTDVGLTFRFPALAPIATAHWERVTDMPFPACHGGSLFDEATNIFYYVGGGLTNTQINQGSAPKSLPMIQLYDASHKEWRSFPFQDLPRGPHLFSLITWIDKARKQLFSIHPGSTIITANLTHSSNFPVHDQTMLLNSAKTYFQRTRADSVSAFQSCLSKQFNETDTFEMYSILDGLNNDSENFNRYNQFRGTWNEQLRDIQFPDVIAIPETSEDVSQLVKCAIATGYRLCSRNGKHSYDGSSSCSSAVVVDMSRMNKWNKIGSTGIVRLGAGMTLGKVALALDAIGFALPSGSCASVGVTGLTLSGGQGPLGRFSGMTSDHLYAIEMVDAEGNIIYATDENDNSDYLWLARGGGTVGHHFPGIITHLHFDNLVQLHEDAAEIENLQTSSSQSDKTTWTRARIRFPANEVVAMEMLLSWHDFHLKERELEQGDEDNLSRRLTIEPWILTQQKRVSPRGQRKRRAEYSQWETTVYLNVYFFGTSQQHDYYFKPEILPILQQNWTSVPGQIVFMERLDHLAFNRKLGGVKNNLQLASGRHGHDLDHQRWQGFSAVATPPAKATQTSNIEPHFLAAAFQSVVETIFNAEPKCHRYVEFKPMGGAILDLSHPKGAFRHRNALWMVLVNHFYSDHGNTTHLAAAEKGILVECQQRHNKLKKYLRDAGWYGGMYAGYLQHTNRLHEDLEQYYGGNVQKIDHIKQKRDPYNHFRHFLPNNVPSLLSGVTQLPLHQDWDGVFRMSNQN